MPHERLTAKPNFNHPDYALVPGNPNYAVKTDLDIPNPILEVIDATGYYGKTVAFSNVNLPIAEGEITALIGPSGCGKSTLLRCFNRMNDLRPAFKLDGEVRFEGENVARKEMSVEILRRQVGMIFQDPNPFPKTIYENIAWAIKINGIPGNRHELVEEALRNADLWDQVKDRLHTPALRLSGGQQQRLCIARALVVKPRVLLMDEPCSALNDKSTYKIEDLMRELRSKQQTIVLVTHNIGQAERVADNTAFFSTDLLNQTNKGGFLVEYRKNRDMVRKTMDQRTEDYLTGRYG